MMALRPVRTILTLASVGAVATGQVILVEVAHAPILAVLTGLVGVGIVLAALHESAVRQARRREADERDLLRVRHRDLFAALDADVRTKVGR